MLLKQYSSQMVMNGDIVGVNCFMKAALCIPYTVGFQSVHLCFKTMHFTDNFVSKLDFFLLYIWIDCTV